MVIDEFEPEPLTLNFNYANNDNWANVHNYETDFENFVPYSSQIALNFNESDSLYFLINITDSLNSFGNIYMLTGSFDFSTESLEEEISRSEYGLQSYPNPFNPETTITFSILNESKVNLSI